MNFDALLKLAREKAEAESCRKYAPSPMRISERRRLVVQYYLEFISPIVVEEAL